MLAQGEPVGVFQVDNAMQARNFSPDERAVAQHLGNQMGLAIKLLQQRSFREQLSRSEKLAAAGRLISSVVNDLQTPLEAISSMADSALEQHTGPPGHELLVISSKPAAPRRSSPGWSLVQWSTPNWRAGRIEISAAQSDAVPGAGMEGVRHSIAHLTKEKPLLRTGLHGQLEQVFLNLLVHAEQALEEAPQKRIMVCADLLAIAFSSRLDKRRRSALRPPMVCRRRLFFLWGEAAAATLGPGCLPQHRRRPRRELRGSSSSGRPDSLFEIELPSISPDMLGRTSCAARSQPRPRAGGRR